MASKKELTEILEERLEGRDNVYFAQLISDWMGSNEMQEFIEFVEVEIE